MGPGPVFNMELVTTSRRPRYYVLRVVYGLALLYLVASGYRTRAMFGGSSRNSIQMMSQMAKWIFSSMTVLQIGAILALVPVMVAGVIAEEKQRKTLHYLLASSLSSTEIVLGKLMARLLQVVVLLAVSLPILSILSLIGGVDPRMVVLAFAASLSISFMLASIAILCSTVARKVRDALVLAYVIEAIWLVFPTMIQGVLRFQYPRFYDSVREGLSGWIEPRPGSTFKKLTARDRATNSA